MFYGYFEYISSFFVPSFAPGGVTVTLWGTTEQQRVVIDFVFLLSHHHRLTKPSSLLDKAS